MKPAPFSCLLLLGLAGCTAVGPDTRVAPPEAPPTFRNAPTGATATAAKAETIETWWHVFNDSELDALEAAARESSPTLAQAAARVEEARARLGVARADTKPGASLSASSRIAGESSERTLPVPGRPVTYRESGDSYRLSFDASYELDLWGRVRRSIESAQAGLLAAEADRRGVHLALSADIAQAHFAIRALDGETEILLRTKSQREDAIGLLRSRVAAGFATDVDVLRAESELASLESERLDLARRRELLVNTLAVLTGRAPSEVSSPASRPLADLPVIPVGLPVEVLRRRPDIALAEATLQARLADIGVAESAKYPSIRLTGGAGFESLELGALLDRPSQFWQIGPSLSLPLFTGGRTQRTIAAAVARAEQSRAEHRQRTLVALKEVEDALAELRLLSGQRTALQQAFAASHDAAGLAEVRHDKGYATYLEVLDARRSELQFERALSQLDGARTAATLRLIRALGGSW